MQTSIEWLENKVKLMIEHNGCEDLLAVLQHIKQAKEMHKKEIINAAIWMPEHFGTEFLSELGKQYYNQTFKQ
jgi:hypothetical protein